MMLSVILLSILMMKLSTLSMIRHMICGNNKNWFLNLNLIYDTLWTGAGSGLLIDFNAGKTPLVSFGWSNNTGAIDVKMEGSVLEEKSSFKMLGLTLSSRLIWALTLSLLLKIPSKKLEP